MSVLAPGFGLTVSDWVVVTPGFGFAVSDWLVVPSGSGLAKATPGVVATAIPTPSAIANVPTRPM
jgi:hypothetical protein